MSRRLAVIAIACAAVVVAAVVVPLLLLESGKPRLTKAQYSTRVSGILNGVALEYRRAGRHGSPKALRVLKTSLEAAGAELAELRPRHDGDKDHDALVKATKDYAIQVDYIRASIEFGDTGTALTYIRLADGQDRMKAAIRRLDTRGYSIRATVVTLP